MVAQDDKTKGNKKTTKMNTAVIVLLMIFSSFLLLGMNKMSCIEYMTLADKM
jgi:hypothetical protein